MEKANKKIELSRKKKGSEILNETYHLLSSNPILILKLMAWGVIPLILLSFVIWFSPSVQQYAFFLMEGNPVYSTEASIGTLIAFAIGVFLFTIYLGVVPFSFLKCYLKQQEDSTTFTTNQMLHQAWEDTARYLPLEILICIAAILTFPIFLYTLIPFSLIQASFLTQRSSYWKAIKEGFTLGTLYWARSFVAALLIALLLCVVILIFSLPYYISSYAYINATLSVLEGNESILPGYFNVMFFLFTILLQFALAICSFFFYTALALYFYNLQARRKEKLSEKKVDN